MAECLEKRLNAGTAHAYECRDAGEEEKRKKQTNNANKQTTSSLAGRRWILPA
jgi:hypothetical protein